MPIPISTQPTTPGGMPTSGYMGPDQGPFECENCTHFNAQSSTCNQSDLLKDKPDGKVDPEACCNYFESAHRSTNEEEHNEGSDDQGGIGRRLADMQ